MSHLGSHSHPPTRCIYCNDRSKSRFLSQSFNKLEGWVWSQWVSSEVVSVTKVHSGPGGDEGQPGACTAARAAQSRGRAGQPRSRAHRQPAPRARRCPPGSCVSPARSLGERPQAPQLLCVHPRSLCAGQRPAAVEAPAQRLHSFPTSGLCALTLLPLPLPLRFIFSLHLCL